MNEIDVHIIHYDEPEWQLDRCLSSLEGQPINIHIVEGVDEFPVNRKHALSIGSAPYVSWVDPDDWVEPNLYEKLLEQIQTDKNDVIYCWEHIYLDDQVILNKNAHHGIMVTRELKDYFHLCGKFIYNFMGSLSVVQEPLYHHDRRSNTRRKRS